MTKSLQVPRGVRAAVYERDGHACARCGSGGPLTLQHRTGRGMGGSRDPRINAPSNLITLCGSGTTGCHGVVESTPRLSRLTGWAVARHDDPAEIPVQTLSGWVKLTDDYQLEPCPSPHLEETLS